MKNSKIFQSVIKDLKNVKSALDANAPINHPVIDKITHKKTKK